MKNDHKSAYELWDKLFSQIKEIVPEGSMQLIEHDLHDFDVMIKSLRKGLRIASSLFMGILFLLFAIVPFLIQSRITINRQYQIIHQNDSLFNCITGAKLNENSGTYTYITRYKNGKLLTYADLCALSDSLTFEMTHKDLQIIDLSDTISILKLKIDILEKYKRITYNPHKSSFHYSYKVLNGKFLTYDEMSKLVDSLSLSLNRTNQMLQLVNDKYNLIWQNTDSTISFHSKSMEPMYKFQRSFESLKDTVGRLN